MQLWYTFSVKLLSYCDQQKLYWTFSDTKYMNNDCYNFTEFQEQSLAIFNRYQIKEKNITITLFYYFCIDLVGTILE